MIDSKRIIDDKNPLLRKKSVDVLFPLSDEDKKLLDEMVEYLRNSQDDKKAEELGLTPGVGIAAIQVGVLKNMFAVRVEDEKEILHEYALVNPRIISNSVAKSYLLSGEGCLSVKGIHEGYVIRNYKIKIQAFDYLTNQDVTLSLKGLVSIVVQHEYDHLFGTLYYDRIDKKNPYKKIEGAYEI